jgi:hypothetical protein
MAAVSAGLRETRYYSKKHHTGQTLAPGRGRFQAVAAPL